MGTPINAEPERCQAYQRPGTPEERPCQSAGRHFAQVDGMPRACCAAHANGARKGSARWQPLATWRATLETEPGRMAPVPGWVRVQTGKETTRAIVAQFGEGATFQARGCDWRAGEELEAGEARAEEESARAWRELGPPEPEEPAPTGAEATAEPLSFPPEPPPPARRPESGPLRASAQLSLLTTDPVRRPTRRQEYTP